MTGWSVEEMESYVKLRKSLASKSRVRRAVVLSLPLLPDLCFLLCHPLLLQLP